MKYSKVLSIFLWICFLFCFLHLFCTQKICSHFWDLFSKLLLLWIQSKAPILSMVSRDCSVLPVVPEVQSRRNPAPTEPPTPLKRGHNFPVLDLSGHKSLNLLIRWLTRGYLSIGLSTKTAIFSLKTWNNWTQCSTNHSFRVYIGVWIQF